MGRDKRGLFEYRGRYTPDCLELRQEGIRCEWVVVAWQSAGGDCEGICGASKSCFANSLQFCWEGLEEMGDKEVEELARTYPKFKAFAGEVEVCPRKLPL